VGGLFHSLVLKGRDEAVFPSNTCSPKVILIPNIIDNIFSASCVCGCLRGKVRDIPLALIHYASLLILLYERYSKDEMLFWQRISFGALI
jgi:hypothetical protein